MTSGDGTPRSVRGSVEALQKLPVVTLVLGLLRLRNAFAHRDGIEYGILTTETNTIPRIRPVAAMWFEPPALGTRVRLADRQEDLFEVIAERATFNASGQFVAFTFPTFMNVLVRAAFEVTNASLTHPEWRSSQTWLQRSRARDNRLPTRRLWRPAIQRRLLGF
jgi:hypothetical protein